MLTNEEVRTALTEKRNATSLSDRINAELGTVDLNIEKTVQDFGFTVPTYMVADIDRKGIIKPKYKNYVGGYGNENRLALQQGSGEKAFNGVVKFLGKTGLRAVGAIGTLTYGIGQAIADRDFRSITDNDLNRAIDDAEAALGRNFAHYYSDEELSRSILGKLGTANFWFDQVGDGLAFVAGALLPEVALTVATGGVGGISLAGSLARIGGRTALRGTAGATAGAFGRSGSSGLANALTKSSLRKATTAEVRGLTAMSPLRSSVDQAGMSVLREAVRRGASRGAAIGRGLDATGRLGRYIGMGAFHEAGIESRHSFKEIMDEFTFTFLEKEGRLPTLEEIREYSSIAEKATNNVFWGNVALLSVTNIPMLGKAYGLGSSGFLKETSRSFKSAGNRILGLEPKIVKGVAQELKPTRFQKVIGNVYKIGTKPIAEGIEEMSQGFMSGAGEKYVEAKYNGNDSYTFLQGLKEIIPEKLSSQEGWEEFTIGAIIGLLGGNLTKVGGVLAGKDMGGSWFISGLGGSESYAAAVERVNKLTELQRKSYNAFTSMNRANSVLQFNKTGESEVIQDVVGDFEFFKGHEGLMSFEEMQKNYNTAVDMIEFTEEMKEEAGFATTEDVDAYKKSLKESFKERYNLYKDGQAFADNLRIGSLKAGNDREVRDALAFQYMVGGRYNENAKNIAKTIARVTGIDGAFDALKFYDGAITERLQSLKSKYSELTEKRDATRKELVTQTQLLDEAKNNLESARVAEKAEDIKKYTDRVALLNNNRTVLVSTLQQLENETNSVRSLANEEIKAVSERFTDVSESPAPTIDDLLRSTKALEDYITALNVSGKQGDASVLMSLIEQYKVYGAMAFEADNFTQRMIASDFFSSREGEQTLKRLVGEEYKNRTEFREFLNSEEELFHKKFGFDGLTPDQVVDRIENFDELSDREKFKVESLIRMGLATDIAFVAGEALADNVNNSDNTDVSVIPVTDTSAIDAVNDVLTERIQGDTVFGTTAVFDESNPNRLEALRTYINQLVEQINLIKTKGLGDKALELGVLKQKIQKLTELLNQLEEGNYPIEQINALLGSETLSESVGFQTMIDNGMSLIDAVNQKIAEQLEDYKNRLKAVEKQYNDRLRRLEEAEVEDMPENKVFNTVDGGYVINGVKYYNNRTNPLEAISRDSEGNIVSVTLMDKDGGVSVFTGEILDELAYNIILKDSATTGGSLESTIRDVETEGRSERFKKIAQERREAIESLTAEKDKAISKLLDEARKVRDKSRAEQVREIIDEANKKIYELQLEAQRLGRQQTATNNQTNISAEIKAIKAERDRRLKELGDELESTNVVDEVLQAVTREAGNIRQTYDREIEALQKEKEGAESQAVAETERRIAELEQQKQEAIAEVISRVEESSQERALHEANSLIEELDNELRSLEEQLIELELEEASGEVISQESRESIENRIAEINASKEGMLERETKRILQEYRGELQKNIEEVEKTFNELIAEQESKPSEEVVSIEQRIAEIRKERDAKIEERVSSLLSGLDKAVVYIAKSEAKKEYKKQLKEEWERFRAEMSKNKVVSELEGEMQAEIENTLKEINDKLEELQLTPREEVEEGATLRGDGTFYTVNGITYKRNDVLTETESPVGAETSRRFATNVVVDGVYRLVEAETLQPSHHGDGTQNPRFFSPDRQPKERDSKASIMNKDAIARAPRFNDLSNSENPYTGAPVIDSRGEIIQGNNRTIGLKEGYRQNKEGYIYKQALAENAEQFGFTKEQVLGMDNPVLVFEAKEVKRVTLSNEVAESNPLSETNAIELGNYVAEDLETGVVNIDVERLNARVPLKVKRAIVERLFRNNEDEETVNALIRKNYSDLIELLKGFLSLSNYEKLSGGVSEPGNVAIVENIIQEFFFMEATPEVRVAWENLSHNMRRGIELSLGYIFAIPELNQGLKDIHRAIVAIYEYQVWRGESYMAFNEWVRSQDMFEGSPLTRFSDEQLNIAKSLVNTRRQSEVVDLFKRYVTSITNLGVDPSQVSMFGERELKTKEEALKDVFGEEVFGSQIVEETERLLAEKQAVEQAIREKYETIINEIKETDGRDITALRGILNRGRVGTSISNALGELNDDVGEGSGGVISNERIQQAIGRVRAELALLGEEVSNLNRLFDFTESTEFKEYVDLLKKEDRTAEEDARLEDLESTLDNWSFIAGTVAGGVALSDVIQQLVAIQQMERVERVDTRQPVESMVEEATRVLNKANNEDIALNQTHATSVRIDKSTTEIAGLTPEYFKELIGEELFSEVRVHPTKNTLLLSNEVVDKINASGQILIFEAMNGVPTVYSNVRRVEVDMSGRISLKPIVSDYDSGLDNNSVYDLQAGEELFFEIDQDSTYNKELIEKAAEEAEQRLLTEKERKDFIKKEVGKRLLTDNRVIELQKIIRGKTEVKTPDDALKIKEAENELKEITQEITKEVEALSLTETKNEGVISEETKKELINQLRIYVVDGKGRRVNMLKGVRDEGASTEVSAKFLALRTEILSDLNKVIQAFMTGETLSTKASKVKVKAVFPGLPNFDIGLNTENEAVKRDTVFTPKMAESIHDVGYVENGKVHTKNETTITNTMFVKQGLEESVGTSGKIPIVVFKKGNQTIAYPVKVLPQEAPVSESEFEKVFNNQVMSDSEKAIEINRLLTEAGFDVATEGVISLTGFDMTTEVQESVLDLVRSKEYLTPVSQWVDKGTSISDNLVGLATIDLNVSEPFIGAKLKMDFGGITLKVDPTEVKTKKAKSRKKVVTSKIFNPDHVRNKIC